MVNLSAFSILSRGTKFNKQDLAETKKRFKEEPKDLEIVSVHSSKVKVTGEDVPEPLKDFESVLTKYNICAPWLIQNVKKLGFPSPTSVQEYAFPILLEKRDLLACAPTGSGKTMAFALPIIHHMVCQAKSDRVFAVVLVPSKELAVQMMHEMDLLLDNAPSTVSCRVLDKRALKNSRTLSNILISTPAMMVAALEQKPKLLAKTRFLVFDEADKLLASEGFLAQSDKIIAACTSRSVVKVFFSATVPSSVEEMALSAMRNPVRVIVGSANASSTDIQQSLKWVMSEQGKLLAMRQILQDGFEPPVLVFVQSIERAKELYHQLASESMNVDVIHSDRTAEERQNVIKKFRLGETWILICTELLARGIDFKNVRLVINYDFPQSVQSYIHRIGRTGRAGRRGKAVTLYTKQDTPYLKLVANVMRASGCELPDWIFSLKAPSKEQKRTLKLKAVKRYHIDKQVIIQRKERARKRKLDQETQPQIGKKKRNRLNRQKRNKEVHVE